MDTHIYNVRLQWKEKRLGEISSPELETSIEIATPPNFNQGMEGIWSPEHLFTAAILSCYMTTFLAIAENSKLEFENFTCNAAGKLEKTDGKFQMTEITLYPTLLIKNEMDRDKAKRVLIKSDQACLISNSVKAKVILHEEIKVAIPV